MSQQLYLKPVNKAILSNSSRAIHSLLEPSLFTFLTFLRLWLQRPAIVFSLAHSLSSPCSRSYYLPDPLSPGPYRCLLCLAVLLVLCHVQAGDMRAVRLLLERFSFYHSRGIMLSMRNKTVWLDHVFLLPRMPIMFHHIWSDRQTDTRTNGHTVRRTSAE